MKKFTKIIIVLLLVLSIGFMVGCGEQQADPSSGTDIGGGSSILYNKVSDNSGTVEEGAKIIYTANYVVQTKELQAKTNEVKAKCVELGGYVTGESSESYAYLCYRVPVAKFEQFLDFMDSLEGVQSKKISSENVELKYNQYEAKIESLTSAKQAYLKLMETPGITIAEIADLLDKIEEIDSELLTYNNMLDTLKNKISYTYVYVQYRETYTPEPTSEIAEFFQEYGEYLVNLCKFVAKALLYLAPFALLAGGVLLIVLKPCKKAKAKKQAALDKKE